MALTAVLIRALFVCQIKNAFASDGPHVVWMFSARAIKSDALAHRSCSNIKGSVHMNKRKKDPIISKTEKSRVSRRNFVKGAATVAAAAATIPLKPLLGGQGSIAEASDHRL